MRMRRIAVIVVLMALVISLALALRPTKSIAAGTPLMSDDQPVVEWIGAHAVRLRTTEAGNGFADMQPLKKMIGNAKIVSLGEATHGSREFFQLKHRMLEFLASEMGFTIFSIEANMPEAYRLNDYVLNGNGDPAKLIKGMYFWTWDTQEVLDMVLWMREFNKSGKGRVQFTGFDMQTPNVAADIVRDFVDKNDPEYADALRKASDVAKAAPQAGGASFGVATTTFPAQTAAGKRIHYSGYIKTENISRGWAGLWWRVDGKSGVLAFDNMHDRGAKGTTDWKRYEIDLPVSADAKNMDFGVLHAGDGSAWFDGLTVEVDRVPYSDTSVFDLDFESSKPKGFHTAGNGYQVRLDSEVFHSGKQSLRMTYIAPPPDPGSFGLATGTFPVKDAAGKRVRFSGYIKTEGVTQGYAGLWWRVDGASGTLAFESMNDRGVTGTTDWKRYEIELPVAAGATNINFGTLFPANGTAWFDALAVELDGVPYQAMDSLNLDFELPLLDNAGGVRNASTTPLGFRAGGNGYEVRLDRDVFQSGKQSLRMKYAQGDKTSAGQDHPNGIGSGLSPSVEKLNVSTWQNVVRHLEESRTAYTKKNVTAQDINWAIQNARVVLQCMQLRANQVTRDHSMADNIKWILDQNPAAKVVLWAHNGHVSTASDGRYDPMGASLRQMFGAQMVVFGFAFNQGSFQAVELGQGLREFTVPPAPPGSLDATFAATGIPLFALDLRAAPKTGPVGTWVSESHKTRNIGAFYSQDSADQYLLDLKAPQSFDVMLFVEKTTAARRNP